MVQSHHDNQLRDRPKPYWKLHACGSLGITEYRQRLRDTNISIPKRCPKVLWARLPAIDSRAQRGMLLYENCTLLELRAFCEQRDIDAGSDKLRRAKLIGLLEAADEKSVFARFEELPPELRLRIYGYSFQFFRHDTLPDSSRRGRSGITYEFPDGKRLTDFDEEDFKAYDVFSLVPPPITQVSKLLRQEALPLFYEKHTLMLGSQAMQPRLLKLNTIRCRRSSDAVKFFKKAPAELLGLVRGVTFFWSPTSQVVRPHRPGGYHRLETVERRGEITTARDGSCRGKVTLFPPAEIQHVVDERNGIQPDDPLANIVKVIDQMLSSEDGMKYMLLWLRER